MTRRSAYRSLIALFAVLFVSLQTTAVAHAAQFGDVPHEHDGMVCEIQTISSEQDVIEPLVGETSAFVSVSPIVYETPYVSAPVVTPPGRAPPPRSPPFAQI